MHALGIYPPAMRPNQGRTPTPTQPRADAYCRWDRAQIARPIRKGYGVATTMVFLETSITRHTFPRFTTSRLCRPDCWIALMVVDPGATGSYLVRSLSTSTTAAVPLRNVMRRNVPAVESSRARTSLSASRLCA